MENFTLKRLWLDRDKSTPRLGMVNGIRLTWQTEQAADYTIATYHTSGEPAATVL